MDDKEILLHERIGTTPFMAPELFAKKKHRGPPVDIWSAGILVFSLLTGNLPWDEPKELVSVNKYTFLNLNFQIRHSIFSMDE